MPSFGDMLEVVDLLKVKAISVEQEKCVAVRNRNSKCQKCVQACIASAIEVSHNEVDIDASACVNCACCVAVCPTGALHAVEPTRAKMERNALGSADASSGCAVVACARKAARREADPEKFSEVPCLGHVGEATLLRLAACGLDDVVLVDGGCASCRYGAASAHIDESVVQACRIFDACDTDAMVTRTSEFPPEVLNLKGANIRGEHRRGILKQTGSYVKTVAGNVAQKTIEDRLGKQEEPASVTERLRVGKNGRIPTFQPQDNYRIVERMQALMDAARAQVGQLSDASDPEGQPTGDTPDATLQSRHFGNVSIDASKCSGCGMCVMFCPTGALKYAEFDEPSDESRRYLEFQAVDCTQCMLCKDVCLRYCLEVESRVHLRDIFDFEPQLVEIARPQNKTSFATLRASRK